MSKTWKNPEPPEWDACLCHEFGRYGGDDKEPRRGDIWFAKLGRSTETRVVNGCRPVFIIGENRRGDMMTVIPITSRYNRPGLVSHIWLEPLLCWKNGECQELAPGMVLVEQIVSIDKSQLRGYVGKLKDKSAITNIERGVMAYLKIETGGKENA